MVKYSFVLPAYKVHFFKEAIDSILTQTYKDFELIIVNDASPENLGSIVKQYDDPRIRYYVNEKNIGGKDLVAQWNHCLEYALGDYVILASDDDVYHPEYLEKMDVLVDKYPEVNVFRPRIQRINNKGDIIHIESYTKEYTTCLEFAYAWTNGYIRSGIPFYLFKKDALKEIGGFVNFPLAWYSDDATVLSLIENGIAISSEILFSFRHSGESISTHRNDSNTLKQKLNATDIFYKWYDGFLKKIVTRNHYEKFYKQSIIQRLETDKRGMQIWCTENSSFRAILSNCSRLLKQEIVSFIYLIRLLLSRL